MTRGEGLAMTAGGLPLGYEFLYHVLQFSMELANLVQTINEQLKRKL
jgi:hypothetical protein